MGRRHVRKPAFSAQARRNRADFASYRRLGCVRRKPGADRRGLAYFGPGTFLSCHGGSVDSPLETADQVDSNRIVPDPRVIAYLRRLY